MREFSAIRPVVVALPVFLAALWPLGVYSQVPFTPLWLSHLAALALALTALRQWHKRRLARPPFEYWWPCAAGAALCALAIFQGRDGDYWEYLLGALLFLCPVVLVHNRRVAAYAFFAFAVAGGAAVLLSVAAAMGWKPPTAIALPAGVALSGPLAFEDGAVATLCGASIGLVAAFHPLLSRRCRILALSASTISALWLLWLAAGMVPDQTAWTLAALRTAGRLDWLLLLLLLWLVARVAARSVLRPPGPAMPPRGWIPLALVLTVLPCIAFGVIPGPIALFVLGLIASHDTPWAIEGPLAPAGRAWVAVGLCVLVQLSGVVPLSVHDPRNQPARCERLLEAEKWDVLDGTLAYLLEQHPGDPALTLLRARSLAAQGWPETAAAAFASAAYDDYDGPEMAAPLAAHQRALLDTLRDQASRLPEGARGLFFERALVHAGETENALEFLALHTASGTDSSLRRPEPLAWALGVLLGAPALETELAEASGATLEGYLAGAGIGIRPLPAGFPTPAAPVLVRTTGGPEGYLFECWYGPEGTRFTVEQPYQAPRIDGAIGATDLPGWGHWEQIDGSSWVVPYRSPDGAVEARLRASDDGASLRFDIDSATAPSGEIETTVFYIP